MPQLLIDLAATPLRELANRLREIDRALGQCSVQASAPGLCFQVTGLGNQPLTDDAAVPTKAPDGYLLTATITGRDLQTFAERLADATAAIERGATLVQGGGVELAIETPDPGQVDCAEEKDFQRRVSAWVTA